MSATQKSWRGLGSNAMACSHEASAKMAARRSSMEEERRPLQCKSFILSLLPAVFIVWVMEMCGVFTPRGP
jgi:hypothetical protein